MRLPIYVAMCSAMVLSGSVLAADRAKTSEAQKEFQSQRAGCASIADADERRTCQREAGAALVESRRGGLTEQEGEYQKNLTARCNYLPAGDREDCERRMRGEGTTSGSAAGGGIYRELRTIVPVPEGTDAGSGATK